MDMSCFDFQKIFGNQKSPLKSSPLLRGNEMQKVSTKVFLSYENMMRRIEQKINFFVQKNIEVEYYKKDTKINKKGDVKNFHIKTKSTPLTKTLSFLARYNFENIQEVIEERINQNLNDKKTFYETIKNHIEKFGLERLLKLALDKRNRIIQIYKKTIIFTSLSYKTAIQSKNNLIQNSKNKNFCNGVFFIPNFIIGKDMTVPVLFNTNYHGHLNQYMSKEYTICIDEYKKRIKFISTKEEKRNISPDGISYLGVDVNIKNNLFSTSENKEIDIDRDLFQGYISFLRKYQEKKNDQTEGEKHQYSVWRERILCMLKKKARELVDFAIASGKNHILMEDLGSFARTYIKSKEFEGFKYSKLARILRLSHLNTIVKGICKKLGVRLTLVPSHYTSQWCFHCGHIDRANRQCQETFSCVCCGHTANADFHSSQAIKLIGSSDVLRSSMLVKDKSSDWIPKKLTKDFIKRQLEEITPKLAFQLNYQKNI